MKYKDTVREVMNYQDCLFFDILIGLHCKYVKRQMGFYGRVKMGFKIARGDWTPGIVQMPSGEILSKAMDIVAEKMDAEVERNNQRPSNS